MIEGNGWRTGVALGLTGFFDLLRMTAAGENHS